MTQLHKRQASLLQQIGSKEQEVERVNLELARLRAELIQVGRLLMGSARASRLGFSEATHQELAKPDRTL
jgi:hypothetical protein